VDVICLGIAILMVVWGQFFLSPSVAPAVLIVFWLLCFFFTLTAVFLALADLRSVRNRVRAEKRALLRETMDDIEKGVSHSARQL
jgi:hypothetical protein